MAFEVVEPGVFGLREALPEGQCSVSKCGKLSLRLADLESVGIGHYAIVLADRESLRLAVRGVRDGEQAQSVAVSLTAGHKRDTGRRALNVARAIGRLGLELDAVAGRYDLLTKGEGRDALLIVNFTAERLPAAELQRIERDAPRHQTAPKGKRE